MRLSEDKISHLSHLLTDGVSKTGLVEFSDNLAALKTTKEILAKYSRLEDEVDALVRKKLHSYARNIVEGSREWDVLYRKHFDEEILKRWR